MKSGRALSGRVASGCGFSGYFTMVRVTGSVVFTERVVFATLVASIIWLVALAGTVVSCNCEGVRGSSVTVIITQVEFEAPLLSSTVSVTL